MLSPMSLVHAFGSGCSDPLGGPFGKAIKSGSPQDVEREIARWVDYKEKNLAPTKKLLFLAPGGDTAKQQWRQRQTLNLLEGSHEKDAACAPGPLLPAAISSGNLEVVRFLLGSPMGLSLKIPENILFSCNYSILHTDEQRTLRRAAFALILDSRKAIVNGLWRGRTVLQECYEPELVTLFIEHGANTTIETGDSGYKENLLDRAVMDAAGFEEGSYTARSAAAGVDAGIRHSEPASSGWTTYDSASSLPGRESAQVEVGSGTASGNPSRRYRSR